MKKFDKGAARKRSGEIERSLGVGLAFYNPLEDAIATKASTGNVDPGTLKKLIELGDLAVIAFKNADTTLGHMGSAIGDAGLADVLARRVPPILQEWDGNEKIKGAHARFRNLGARDASLKGARDELAPSNFDLLTMEGADGTFASLVKKTRTADVENLVQTLKDHGLPTIMGRGSPGAVAGGVVGTLLVIGGVLIIVSWFL